MQSNLYTDQKDDAIGSLVRFVYSTYFMEFVMNSNAMHDVETQDGCTHYSSIHLVGSLPTPSSLEERERWREEKESERESVREERRE